jgi:hypothetical protein
VMHVDDHFHLNSKKAPVECKAQHSMSLMVGPGYEDKRISVRFVPENDNDLRRLVVRMNRSEAKALGERLLDYGSRVLPGE